MAGLTDKGIREFHRAHKAALAEVEPLTASLPVVIWQQWAGEETRRQVVEGLEHRLTEAIGFKDNAQSLKVFEIVSEIERHAFLVGFEAARRGASAPAPSGTAPLHRKARSRS